MAPPWGPRPPPFPIRLSKGEKADVVILARGALDDLAAKGLVRNGTQIDLVRSAVGVAVKKGAPIPDISSEDKLRQVPLNAKSIAYSASASGNYYETQMLKNSAFTIRSCPRAGKIVTERVGTIVARGEAEIGLQQVSELLPIEGISYVGTLPDSVQHYTIFSAGTASTSTNPQGWSNCSAYYTSPAAAKTIRDTGLEPSPSPAERRMTRKPARHTPAGFLSPGSSALAARALAFCTSATVSPWR